MRSHRTNRQWLTLDHAPLVLAVARFLLLWLANINGGYGIFRDEYYYLACTAHLDWGFVDHPPLSIALLAVQTWLLGDSVLALRFLPAVVGGLTIYLGAKIIRELGGGRFARLFGSLCFFFIPSHTVIHSFYSMNTFDLLAWALLIWVSLKAVNTRRSSWWLWFGLIVGLGLMNKYSVAFLIIGLVVAFLLSRERTWLATRRFWIGAVVAALLFLPHIIWQVQHDWPTAEFIANARAHKIIAMPPLQYLGSVIEQLNPLMAPIWLTGLFYLFLGLTTLRYRLYGLAFVVIIVILTLQPSKPYYAVPAFFIPFAAGSVAAERFAKRRFFGWLKPAACTYVVLAGLLSLPLALPLLSIDALLDYQARMGRKPVHEEHGLTGNIPQYFADRFGWKETVETIAQVYNGLSAEDRAGATIVVDNYGEAGAVDYYRGDYGLPHPACPHNSYWYWLPDDADGDIAVVLASKEGDLSKLFETVTPADTVRCRYCLDSHNGKVVYLCRNLQFSLDTIWARSRTFD